MVGYLSSFRRRYFGCLDDIFKGRERKQYLLCEISDENLVVVAVLVLYHCLLIDRIDFKSIKGLV